MARELDIELWDVTAPTVTEKARRLAPMLKAVADETRLTLMLLLAERPRTVRELTDATGMSQTLVSHHLTPLREQQLIIATPKGRSNVYSLCCDGLVEPVRLLASLAATGPGADCSSASSGPAAAHQPATDALSVE
ncbi:winged helix-turn-helix transcriptional regulator [Saccharopolyspora erythraea]|uniref:ArsR/SmtB family transcription factor n=1 Tax=Saccharopolyspora erythraea TaxID=1836 RepID=UPI001BAAE8BD|nr:metalloregulator ArsR/SmtB family transcription factor [Saccharopolyspora erythraea]QUH01856.1 winged helix-turn-helix transcriptional regulator [Saccharopolyspora erythraea]